MKRKETVKRADSRGNRHDSSPRRKAAKSGDWKSESEGKSDGRDAKQSKKHQQQKEPGRDKHGTLLFEDHPEFRPNLTPKEILQLGSFGGTYFRPIHSGVTGEDYDGVTQARELPTDWLDGLDLDTQVCSSEYRTSVNQYKVKSGASLEQWENKDWIIAQDPFGWFQWYCRFYRGRRTKDDDRQIARAHKVMGPKGRFRTQLMNKVLRSNARFDDKAISPVVRQTLQHWAYRLSERDLKRHLKDFKG
mmetsp:Transcript_15528/g.41755  ORF Transcript_15528/g.41755 Transcript_15528/m.41755 type:complete len:247 (-) Transcript_15528:542-1282(-)